MFPFGGVDLLLLLPSWTAAGDQVEEGHGRHEQLERGRDRRGVVEPDRVDEEARERAGHEAAGAGQRRPEPGYEPMHVRVVGVSGASEKGKKSFPS